MLACTSCKLAAGPAGGVPRRRRRCCLHNGAAPACAPANTATATVSTLQVYAQLDRAKAVPNYNSYLAFIFASGEGLPVEVRAGCAGPGVGWEAGHPA